MFAALAALALVPACRGRNAPRADAAAAAPAPVVEPPAGPLFARDEPTARVRVERWLARDAMLAPFVAAVDGQAAALSPDGTLRYTPSPGARGEVALATLRGPCHFDPSRHNLYWTIPNRVALDGRGHVCCVHDGDAAAPAGAFCADLRAIAPRFVRARTPLPPTGVGSGEGALAMFASDVWCTRDGGAQLFATFRGDAEQPLSGASCSGRGDAVAVGGSRASGALRDQTVRAARAGEALVMLRDAPRGEPFDARARLDGSVHVLLSTPRGTRYVARDASGAVSVREFGLLAGATLGAWGPRATLLVPSDAPRLLAFEPGRAAPLSRELAPELVTNAPIRAATRVGTSLLGVTRDGAFVVLARD